MKKLLAIVLLSAATITPALADPFYVGGFAGDQYLGVLGGYQFDKMFAGEVHYAKVLTPDVNTPIGSVTTDNYSLGADVVVTLPWKVQKVPELSFFGKGGLEYVSTKVTTNGLGVTTTEVKLTLGGGAQYDVTKNFSARAGLGILGSHKDLYVAAIYKF